MIRRWSPAPIHLPIAHGLWSVQARLVLSLKRIYLELLTHRKKCLAFICAKLSSPAEIHSLAGEGDTRTAVAVDPCVVCFYHDWLHCPYWTFLLGEISLFNVDYEQGLAVCLCAGGTGSYQLPHQLLLLSLVLIVVISSEGMDRIE